MNLTDKEKTLIAQVRRLQPEQQNMLHGLVGKLADQRDSEIKAARQGMHLVRALQ